MTENKDKQFRITILKNADRNLSFEYIAFLNRLHCFFKLTFKNCLEGGYLGENSQFSVFHVCILNLKKKRGQAANYRRVSVPKSCSSIDFFLPVSVIDSGINIEATCSVIQVFDF